MYYPARNSIQLNAGFEAKAGTVFEAKFVGCN
ncbi:MAG: 3-coathanger stack domain-containing protein [Spirosomataceae bacterium]